MMYRKVAAEGYVIGLALVETNGNIDRAEFERLSAVFRAKPAEPEGFYYRLREDESWELTEKPAEPESEEEEARAEDYEQALRELGVSV